MGVKSKATGIPGGDGFDHIAHHRSHIPHAHEMKEPGADPLRQPQRQPVVATVDHGVGGLTHIERGLPESRQKPITGNFDRRMLGGVLPAGLVHTLHLQQLNSAAVDGERGALGGHNRDPVATPHQPLHQGSEGELHTSTLATAEGPDGRVDDDEVKRRHRHEEGSASGSGSQNRRR